MRKEFKIGLAGIGALLILFFGINYLKGISMFKPESYYHVEFENINGLSLSSPVFANGYQIGIVRDISYNYNNPGHVTVGIEVEENLRIPEGSQAELITEMLGTVKMNMKLNHEASTYVQPGDTIEGVANNGILGEAEETLLPQIERMLPKLDSILTSVNALVSDPALRGILRNTEQLTASLNATGNELHTLVSEDLPRLAGNITDITDNLKGISENLKDVDYASTFVKIDSTLQNVRLLTDKLNRKDNSLGLLLNDESFYNNLNSTAANAASLLKDLQEHPKRYVHFSLFGRKDR